jgi:hypothetical protein
MTSLSVIELRHTHRICLGRADALDVELTVVDWDDAMLEGEKIPEQRKHALAQDPRYPVQEDHRFAETWFNTWSLKYVDAQRDTRRLSLGLACRSLQRECCFRVELPS